MERSHMKKSAKEAEKFYWELHGERLARIDFQERVMKHVSETWRRPATIAEARRRHSLLGEEILFAQFKLRDLRGAHRGTVGREIRGQEKENERQELLFQYSCMVQESRRLADFVRTRTPTKRSEHPFSLLLRIKDAILLDTIRNDSASLLASIDDLIPAKTQARWIANGKKSWTEKINNPIMATDEEEDIEE